MENFSALKGLKVLDFSHLLAGPFATQILGDYGATIYKIERAEVGDDYRRWHFFNKKVAGTEAATFLSWNRNKRSLAIDMKSSKGKEIIYNMTKDCDVVIQNFRPGVMDKLGYGYEDLKKINPKIIYCNGSGYGRTGPYAKRPGQDLLIQGMSGLTQNTGRANGPPVPVGAGMADQLGSYNMVIGILTAIYYRDQSGKGQEIQVDLLSCLLQHELQEFVAVLNLNQEFERAESGIGHPGTAAPFGVFKTKDGYLSIAIATLDLLAEVLGDETISSNYKDDGPKGAFGSEIQFTKRDEIFDHIEMNTKKFSTQYLLDTLLEQGAWVAPVYTHKQVLDDPQVKHMNMFTSYSHEKYGKVKTVSPVVKMSETPPKITRPAPLVGEHGYEILEEFGYSKNEIEKFENEKIISVERVEK
jgi:crotonobetainyl-CoA:carnitine CoA-transferase CaiB-like acyl-CoA transferase|tara:strand:+ start:156 stop:1397 length:1242 start_codon:yes stop_codon:yes gene_type:complete